jgi:hypothetical protein
MVLLENHLLLCLPRLILYLEFAEALLLVSTLNISVPPPRNELPVMTLKSPDVFSRPNTKSAPADPCNQNCPVVLDPCIVITVVPLLRNVAVTESVESTLSPLPVVLISIAVPLESSIISSGVVFVARALSLWIFTRLRVPVSGLLLTKLAILPVVKASALITLIISPVVTVFA